MSTSCAAASQIIGSPVPRAGAAEVIRPDNPARRRAAEPAAGRARPPARSLTRRGAATPSRRPSGPGSGRSARSSPVAPAGSRRAGSGWRAVRTPPPRSPPAGPTAYRTSSPTVRTEECPTGQLPSLPLCPSAPPPLCSDLPVHREEPQHRPQHDPDQQEQGGRIQLAIEQEAEEEEDDDPTGEPEPRGQVFVPPAHGLFRRFPLHDESKLRACEIFRKRTEVALAHTQGEQFAGISLLFCTQWSPASWPFS